MVTLEGRGSGVELESLHRPGWTLRDGKLLRMRLRAGRRTPAAADVRGRRLS